jgi:hypothetical protein
VSIVGSIDWQDQVSGFCRCPGERMHTSSNGKKDCRVSVDGAPTIFCFHASCAAAVAEANRKLRRELGASDWELRLPDGQRLRSGDVLRGDGTVVARDDGLRTTDQKDSQSQIANSRSQLADSKSQTANGRSEIADSRGRERMVLEALRAQAERFRGELFDFFRWPMGRILEESPLLVAEREAEDQFRTWLRLWPEECTVWIGDVYSSGSPEHRTHFRTVAEWYQIGPVMGNFTCGSSFKAGSFRRSNENLNGHRFLVVESDSLSKDEVGAVFAYLWRRLRYELHCIVDTGGKSLHGWFDAPRNKVLEERLKAGLVVFGCDPKVFTYSQPVRVPGAWREGRLQRLIWLRG